MGINQSNVMEFMRIDSNGKSYVVPVVLPAHKVHSSSSSLATMDSQVSNDSGKDTSEARFYMDAADNAMFQNLLKEYDCGQLLGKGSSAQVFEVTHKTTGQKFACKVVHKNSSINDEGTMLMETEIMKRMRHDNITSLHELYETDTSKWFIMEMANGGSLHTALASEDNYTEELVATNFKQVLQGVKYLHDMGIVHRDLKQDNILCQVIDTNGKREYVVKIADFGLSAVVKPRNNDPKSLKKVHTLKEMWGTKEYFAPEVYKKAYGPQADVWALGCVLYELLTGEVPFPTREIQPSRLDRILLNGGKKPKRYYELRSGWRDLSSEAQDLIHKMLKVNPKKRFSIQECLNHPFILRSLLMSPSESSNLSSNAASQYAGAGMVVVHPVEGGLLGKPKPKILVTARAVALHRAQSKITRTKALAADAELAMRIAAAVATATASRQ